MVTEGIEPRPIRIRARGDWLDESGPVVDAGVPDWITPSEIEGRRFTRLDLANWLTSEKNPLTARVFVNRLWAQFFGQGLSRSLDDFGAQGESPSHPELLDFLACEFAETWDVKRIVYLIATSEAYQRSSLPTPDLASKDPETAGSPDRWRSRLPAEMIRAQALDLSGLLIQRVGGPKSQPYQPAGYYQFLNFRNATTSPMTMTVSTAAASTSTGSGNISTRCSAPSTPRRVRECTRNARSATRPSPP